jgi:hypothetical protein
MAFMHKYSHTATGWKLRTPLRRAELKRRTKGKMKKPYPGSCAGAGSAALLLFSSFLACSMLKV